MPIDRNSRQIKLLSWKGDYLTHLQNGDFNEPVRVTPKSTFWTLEFIVENKVRLKSFNGYYLRRSEGPRGSPVLMVDSYNGFNKPASLREDTTWTLWEREDGTLQLQSYKGDYLHRPEDLTPADPNGTTVSTWDAKSGWTIEEHPGYMRPSHGLTRLDRVVHNFGRLLPANPITGNAPDGQPFTAKTMVAALETVADHMCSDALGASTIEAGMTFFGQMIDHDITLDAKSEIGKVADPSKIGNLRTPTLDLDCVYGNGPEASPWLYSPKHHGFLLFGTKANPLDLPRNDHGTALIGDPRNDENHILSSLQGTFITLHNLILTDLMKDPDKAHELAAAGGYGGEESEGEELTPFDIARQETRRHFRYLVEFDFLHKMIDARTLSFVYGRLSSGQLPAPFKNETAMMPIEFAAAAFRFGHATVQSDYIIQDNGTGTPSTRKLFDLGGFGAKPDPADNVDLALFCEPRDPAKPHNLSRRIGTHLAAAIYALPASVVAGGIRFGDVVIPAEQARKLPLRNLLRDRLTFQLPSGEQMAGAMTTAVLPLAAELSDAGLEQTPLWYYCLKEAEGTNYGQLGQVGGTIVATTLLRLLDPTLQTYVNRSTNPTDARNFKTKQSAGLVRADPSEHGKIDYSLRDVVEYVAKHRAEIPMAQDLITG